jgi:hypothetical protein
MRYLEEGTVPLMTQLQGGPFQFMILGIHRSQRAMGCQQDISRGTSDHTKGS